MNPRRRALAALTALAAAGWPSITAAQGVVDVAGIKYAPTAQVAGSTLQLNGAGLRTRFVIKVYTAGLYVPKKGDSAEALLGTPGPKRMHVVMLRDIDANELGKLFTRGMQDNMAKGEFSKFIPGTIRMSEIFSAQKRLKAGDSFYADFIPGSGTHVIINGKDSGDPIKEPEFFNGLMRIWLGANPADSSLKDALLGKPQVVNTPQPSTGGG
jgi:Chalcone isomerase-like